MLHETYFEVDQVYFIRAWLVSLVRITTHDILRCHFFTIVFDDASFFLLGINITLDVVAHIMIIYVAVVRPLCNLQQLSVLEVFVPYR